MFGNIANYENKLFLSGQEVLAVDSVSINRANSPSVKRFLGCSRGHTMAEGAPQQSVSVSRSLVYNDPILAFTGDYPMSGSVHYNGSSYGFSSGYLDEYMVNCAVGAIPKVSVNFTVHDEMGSGIDASGSTATPTILTSTQGSISMTCDHVSSNRVVGFDYAVKVPRKPVFRIGSKLPASVETVGPLEYSATVQIDVDDAFMQSGMAFLDNRQDKVVLFSIKDRDLTTVIQELTIPNASLVGEALASASEGGVKLTLNYIGHS